MLGLDLQDVLRAHGVDVVAPVRNELNIVDPESVAQIAVGTYGKLDWCVNCAAYTAVDRAESEPDLAADLNALAPGYLASACSIIGCRLVHLSTDFVFDGEQSEPYAEDAPTNPLGVYGTTKRDGEFAVQLAMPGAVIVRTAWLYGARGSCFPKTIIRAWLAGKDLRVVDDQLGTPTCTIDLAESVAGILIEDVSGGMYHAAGPEVMSWRRLAEMAIAAYGEVRGIDTALLRIEPIHASDWPTPARRPKYSALSSAKLQKFGISQMRPVRESLLDFCARLEL